MPRIGRANHSAMVIRLIAIVTMLVAPSLTALGLCVAVNGSDDNSGTREKPFATFDRARDEIRKLKQNGRFPKSGVTIRLRGGDYVRTNALELTAADSGTA